MTEPLFQKIDCLQVPVPDLKPASRSTATSLATN